MASFDGNRGRKGLFEQLHEETERRNRDRSPLKILLPLIVPATGLVAHNLFGPIAMLLVMGAGMLVYFGIR